MTEVTLFLFYTALFLFFLQRSTLVKSSGIRYGWLVIFFFLKVAAGETAWLIYHYIPQFQGSSDSFRYFQDGLQLNHIFYENKKAFLSLLTGIPLNDPLLPESISKMISWNRVYDTGWFNENRSLIRFNALIAFISLKNYHIHLLIGNIFSFTGLLYIYQFFHDYTHRRQRGWLVLCLFALPCLLFWGSIPSKETIAILGIGIILSGIKKLSDFDHSFNAYLRVLTGLLVLFSVRYYLVILGIPPLISFIYNERSFNPRPINIYLSLISVCFFMIVLLNWLWPSFDPAAWLLMQQNNSFGLAASRGQVLSLTEILKSSNIIELFVKSPLAFLSGFIIPYCLRVVNGWNLVAAAENTMIIFYIFYWGIRCQKTKISSNMLMLFFIVFLFDMTIIGFTTPFPGAVHRYRILTLPLFLCSLSCCTERRSLSLLEKIFKPGN